MTYLNIAELTENELDNKINDFKNKLLIMKRCSNNEITAINLQEMVNSLMDERSFRAGNTQKKDISDRGIVLETGGYPKENENG